MPSSWLDRMLPRRLVTRVAWVTFATIVGSAACVTLISGVFAKRFAQEREDQQLTNAASVLAVELVEPGADPLFQAADEARELKPTGIRVAVYEGQHLFAGDAELPSPGREGCAVIGAFTTCGVHDGRFLAVAARDTTLLRGQLNSILLSSLLAVAVTGLLGAVFVRRIAILLVAPLSRLTLALQKVPEDAPETADIGADEGVEEVDSLKRTLRATFERLGYALATSRRFAADAAHELRSPLTVIMGQLELNSSQLKGETKESNDRARRTAVRLSTLVDRLLVLATPAAKLTSGEEIDLHAIADDAMDLTPREFWSRVHTVAESEAFLRGDRALLAAMIANAVENALKFSKGMVVVRLVATEQHVQFHISDDGPGIAEAERQRVFEPFFRTRSARASGTRGHGIGLALIAHVAAVHGGTARFLTKDRGTCLAIELPRAR